MNATVEPTLAPEAAQSPARAVWRRFGARWGARPALALLMALVLACLLGPLASPHRSHMQDLSIAAQPPSPRHWMGTDMLGRDLLVRVVEGGRVSLAVGLCGTLVAVLIGVVYGATAGYLGGRTDAWMMRFVDVLYALPFTIFVIILTVLFGRHFLLIFVAIGAVEWLTMARIVRGQVLSVRRQPYVLAARLLGFSHPRVLFRHVLPNVTGTVIVYATLTIPQVILLESFLSFLGLGIQPPLASWGLLIRDGAAAMESAWWLLVFPGAALCLCLLTLHNLGDALRDALDPRAHD